MKLLIRVAAKVTASSQWSTLSESSAEGKHNVCKMHVNSVWRKSALSEKKEDFSETEVNLPEKKVDSVELLYEKILNVLISYLLMLQLRNAFCMEESWKAFLNEQIEEGLFKGRWCVDYAGFVWQQGVIYVLNDCTTRMEILHVNHDDPWQEGHFGQKRTWEIVKRSYWWPWMKQSVREYVDCCNICQRMKALQHKLYRLLALLLQSERPWQDIAINFITGLLPSKCRKKAYDAILVVVDQFFKMICYILCIKEIDASELADRLIKIVFLKKKTLRFIVSDRGSTFMLKYWSTFCYYMIVKRCLLTAFYLQTDD